MSFFGIKTKKEKQKEYHEWYVKQETEKKILAEKEHQELVEKYKKNTRIQKAAEDFANSYIVQIKQLLREKDIEKLWLNYGFGVRLCKGIEQPTCTWPDWPIGLINYYEGLYENGRCASLAKDENGDLIALINFYEENLQCINDHKNLKAFFKAISLLAYDYITEKYLQDESGTAYTLTVEEIENHDYFILFRYRAKNGNYIPPQKWF